MPSPNRPPTCEYSPSVFSLTTQKSMSPGLFPASGHGTPGSSRTGRRLTYCSNARRIGISSPHSDTWSGTPGNPTAPSRIASWSRSRSIPSSGIIRPLALNVSHDQSKCRGSTAKPNFAAAASSTASAGGITSRPMPSPGITAMR